ncbi:MAG: NADH-quinone oxidoreductase subunit NuoK [Planctomycetaceae bacterium]|nr:NADH-quinone oxidoreductase subunit NuoK [Planctomycetaceae bacterium]
MTDNPILLADTGAATINVALLMSALLFVIGLVGFLSRRNMILMFLCTELMFQAAALAMIAFGKVHGDLSGQVFVIFILTVAAAEAALALGLVVLLYRRRETLDSEAWSELREA